MPFFCCFVFSFFWLSTNSIFFRGKNSIVPFLCREEEFITLKEEKEEEEELKKKRAELFCSCSGSRSLSSSLSAGAKRESGVFFFKRVESSFCEIKIHRVSSRRCHPHHGGFFNVVVYVVIFRAKQEQRRRRKHFF